MESESEPPSHPPGGQAYGQSIGAWTSDGALLHQGSNLVKITGSILRGHSQAILATMLATKLTWPRCAEDAWRLDVHF